MGFKTLLANQKRGQSTVEFAIIMAAFLALLVCMGALWRVFDEGLFVEHAQKSASHHLYLTFPEAVGDVLVF